MQAVLEKTQNNHNSIINWTEYKPEAQHSEIWMADLSGSTGSVQGGVRPVVVVQNRMGNIYAPTVIVCPISSSTTKKPLPTHVHLNAERSGLLKDSVVFAEQIRTIDKWFLMYQIGKLDSETMNKVKQAIHISLELN